MTSRFHGETLRRLSLAHEPDEDATRALHDRARKLRIALPASFLEWYWMRRGPELLRQKSNSDDPVAIERLGEPCKWRWNTARDLVADGLLLFMVENQAVCIWAVKLNAGDDPAVVVARDPDLEWRPCAERFSTFVACQVLGPHEGLR